MLNRIIQFSLTHRPVVLVAAVLLMLAGFHVAQRMDVDVFPDLNAPTVAVMTEAKGMAPEEVERLVTFPVETSVNGAAGVRRVRSSSTTGFSIVWVEFDWGTDIYQARQVVAERVAVVVGSLPPGVGAPTLGPQSSILGELMIVALTADTTSMQELRTLADWTLRPRLLAVGGVAQVSVLGGDVREYQILLNPDRMSHYGVTLPQVMAAVQDMNRNAAGGVLYEYGNEYILRGMLSTNRLDELRQAPVGMVGNAPVVLSQVADVKVGSRVPRTGVAAYRSKPAVLLTVTKQPGVSTLELTDRVDDALAEMQPRLPKDVKVATDSYRQERFINSSLSNVKHALLEGGLLVVVVLFVFLMNVRTTLISLVTIPLSLLVSVLVLHLMGFTINTMSLGGMSIAIGSLVDDAIVDVENVYRRLRENRLLPASERLSPLRVVYEASREVRMPVLNSSLIIIASFVPLFFLSGMEGRMLVPLGVAFIVALGASTLVALTLTPCLCSYLLARKDSAVGGQREPWVSRHLKWAYAKALRFALARSRAVLVVTALVAVAAIVAFAGLGRNFLPPFNEGSFTVSVSTLPGVSLDESDAIGRSVEKALLAVPEIQTVARKTGRAELDEHALGVNNSELEAPFELDGRSKDEVMADIRQRLHDIPGISVEVGSPITHRIDAMLSGTRAAIAIKVYGTDLGRMYAIGRQIEAAIQDVEGIADLNVEQQVERPQLKIIPKRDMLARYGITLPEFGQMVRVLLAGEVVSQVNEGDRAFDLVVRTDNDSRATARSIGRMAVDAAGQKVPLSSVADVVWAEGPGTINRENAARKIVVSANVEGRDLHGVVSDIRQCMADGVKLPEGYRVEYGGQFESEQAASRTLLVASIFAIIVIFLLLYGQFRNAVQSAVILLNLPLALIGGVFAIVVSGGVVSIPAIIGFISLFGIATRNGMLLVGRYNDLRAEGLPLRECVMRGSADRLNPILMTALTSGLALVPLVLGGGLPGNELQSPMAKVILGGLLTSTLLNGFIVPIIYLMTNRKASACTDETK